MAATLMLSHKLVRSNSTQRMLSYDQHKVNENREICLYGSCMAIRGSANHMSHLNLCVITPPTYTGVQYCNQPVCLSVCLSTSIYLEPLDRLARNFVCRSPVAVAQSSSGGAALRYVLPVLWMTSRLAVMGATPARVGITQRRRSITCATGAESDVYECVL